jgi:hypothetical protein
MNRNRSRIGTLALVLSTVAGCGGPTVVVTGRPVAVGCPDNSGADGGIKDDCLTDKDCGASGVCSCKGSGLMPKNVCVPSNCRVDADCGAGAQCSPSHGGPTCAQSNFDNVGGYYCRSPALEDCQRDSDCQSIFGTGQCGTYNPQTSRWGCNGWCG